MLETVVIEPEQPAQGAVIFLHGLGADGHDFEPIVPELGVDDLQLRFVFPTHQSDRSRSTRASRSGLGMTLCLTRNMQEATTSRPQRSQSRPSFKPRSIRESHPSASCLPGSPKAA